MTDAIRRMTAASNEELAALRVEMGRTNRITLKEAAGLLGVSHSYLKGELGITLTGWRFAMRPLTTMENVEDFRQRFVPIAHEPIKAPGVYIVGFQRFIKIGISVNIRDRIAGLQTAIPFQLKVHAVLPGGQMEEASLHRRFKAYRMSGEWFRKSGALATWVDGGCR